MEKLTSTQKMELAKRYGTVFLGHYKYWLLDNARMDNYGTDGDVRYYAKAVDRHGNEYRVAWETLPDYSDETSACDWDRPVEVKGY